MRQDRLELAAPPHLSELRRHALLRLVAEPPRLQACESERPPGRRLRRAGGALAVLLSRRGVCGVRGPAGEPHARAHALAIPGSRVSRCRLGDGWHLPDRRRVSRRPRDVQPSRRPSDSISKKRRSPDLLRDQQSGRRTARQIAEQYLSRIQALDRNGPSLHSVIELNPDALAIADALDAERQTGGPRGPLHGIPVLIKDNIDTADRMTTTAGSLALEGSIAARDAFIVERLRAAGAVILGKTNLSEWANFRSTHSTSGWSGRGGLVLQSVRARSQSVRIELRHRRPPSPRTSRRLASARRPTGRSSVRPARRRSSASSRRSGWSAGPASSRSRTARTPPGRWPARSRRGDPARRSVRRRSARSGDDGARAGRRRDYRASLDAERPARRAHRRGAREVLRLQRRRPTGSRTRRSSG